MKNLFLTLAALILVFGMSLVGSEEKVLEKNSTCSTDQFEAPTNSGEITCINNVDIKVNL